MVLGDFERKWQVVIAVVIMTLALSSAAPFGGWTCNELTNGERAIISQGDFTLLDFMPFISPFVAEDCEETSRRYNPRLNCTFEVAAPESFFIYMEFVQFQLDIDCVNDFVHLVQLGNPREDLIPTNRFFCDQLEPTNRFIIVPGNRLQMTFLTDSDFACTGFAGFFAAFNPNAISFSSWFQQIHRSKNIPTGPSDLITSFRRKYFLALARNRWQLTLSLSRPDYCEVLEGSCLGLKRDFCGKNRICRNQLSGTRPTFLRNGPRRYARRGKRQSSLCFCRT